MPKMRKMFLRLVRLSLFLAVLTSAPAFAANDPVVMKIDGKEVQASEFFYIYDKYHTNSQSESTSVKDYVPMFVDFKLKIEAALDQELDTLPSFKKELDGYRKQLEKQYVDPLKYSDNAIKAIYNQSKDIVEVSHIFIKMPQQSFPVDTLAAYEKAMRVYERLQKEPFEKVALEVSDDIGSDKTKPGYMGYLHSLLIAKSFIDGAYATPVGAYSLPIRTLVGYHIIKVHDRKENPGEMLAAHILLLTKEEDAEKKELIDRVYASLKEGADFGELAKQYSEDANSAKNNGELPWFGVRAMVPEFEEEADALSVGEYSAPFLSRYGYHIVKLIARRPYSSYEAAKDGLIQKAQKITDHADAIKKPYFDFLKEVYDFQFLDDAYNEIIEIGHTYFPKDSLFAKSLSTLEDKPLFALGADTFMRRDFFKSISAAKTSPFITFSDDLIHEKRDIYISKALLEKEKSELETRYVDFKNLMNEYYGGMLLFEISSNEVWDKAGKDTEGLQKCFKQHKSDYKWLNKKYKGLVVLCKDEAVKQRVAGYGKELNIETVDKIVKEHFNADSIPEVKVIKGVFSKGDDPIIDKVGFDKKGKEISLPEGYTSYYAKGKLLSSPESYKDVRGLVISDYQEELEKAWLKSLHEKYPVEIYWDVIEEYKKQD